jgi:hypothetical protein
MESQQTVFPQWMRGFLLIATAYNAGWGIFIRWFPDTFYSYVTETPNSLAPSIISWQGLGVLAMALIYLAIAIHPGKLWYMAFFGVVTKVGGAIWFYFYILNQHLGDQAIFHLLMNDLIWVPALIGIGLKAKQYGQFKRASSFK